MRYIAKSLLFLIFAVVLVGCSTGKTNEEPMTVKTFKNIMEDKGLSVENQLDSANGDTSYQDIYVATSDNKYSFEYYFMIDVESAKNVYEYARNNLDSKYKDNATAFIKEDKSDDYGSYEVAASDYYCVVYQKKNTVLYLTADSNNKDDAETILREMGY